MENLFELLARGNILLDLEVRGFEDCLLAMIRQMVSHKLLTAEQGSSLEEEALSREKLGVTAIGRGVVIPHAYLAGMPADMVCFARLKGSIEYDAPDGHPVDLVFLLSGPAESHNNHLRMLARIVRLIRDDELLAALRGAGTADEVAAAFKAVESRHA